MVYVLLIAGVLIAGFGLYRFVLRASPKQVGTLIVVIGTLVISAAVFVLAISGRLPAAVGVLAALWPLFYSIWRSAQQVKAEEKIFDSLRTPGRPSRTEALEILGLSEGATEEDIKAAHKRLMKKAHPDQAGSDWMARKINAARDELLKNR